MKKQTLMLTSIVMAVMLSVSAVCAQNPKMDMSKMPKGDMNMMSMMDMHKDGHHMLMMAHKRSATAFARVLWDMTADGKIENVAMARAAFAEIEHCMEKMADIHKMQMGKMDSAMMETMKPMMEKMQAEQAAMKMHMDMLSKALQVSTPNAQEVSMHAAWLLLKLEKMNMPEMKMDMPGKMAM